MTSKRKFWRGNTSILLVTLTLLTNVIPSMTVSAAWEKEGGVIGRIPQEESRITTKAKVVWGTFEEIPDETQKEESTQEELHTKEERLEDLSDEQISNVEVDTGEGGDLEGDEASAQENSTQGEIQYAYLVVRTLHGLEELSGGTYRLYSKTSVTDESGQIHTPDTWIEQSESSDGICMFTTRLPIGTYYVEEVDPPPGYYQAETTMELTITPDTFAKEDPSEPCFAFVTLSYYEASQMRSAAIWQFEETPQEEETNAPQVEDTKPENEEEQTKEDPETEGVSETEEEKLEGTTETNPMDTNETKQEEAKEDPETEGVSETEEEKLEGTMETNPKDANETKQEKAKEYPKTEGVLQTEEEKLGGTKETQEANEEELEQFEVGLTEYRMIDVRAPDEHYGGGVRASPASGESQDTIEDLQDNTNGEVSIRYE
jgi:hypothetical protein